MWGGRFTDRPDAIMEEINVSIDVDRHLYAQDIAASKAHAAMLAAQGIITGNDAKKNRQGSRHDFVRDRQGIFRLQARARGHSHECREQAWRVDRARCGRCTPRVRATIRSRRFPAVCPRHHRRDGCGAGLFSACAGGAGAGTCRHGDAGFHASADRAAGRRRRII